MKERIEENRLILSTLDADEQTTFFARRDCQVVTCIGRGLYQFMRRLLLQMRNGRIGGTLVLCRMCIGQNSGINIGNFQRLTLPFSNISEAHWVLSERMNDLIFVEYVFKKDETNP